MFAFWGTENGTGPPQFFWLDLGYFYALQSSLVETFEENLFHYLFVLPASVLGITSTI